MTLDEFLNKIQGVCFGSKGQDTKSMVDAISSSGGGVLIANVETFLDPETGDSAYVLDKTAGEMLQAIRDGKNVYAKFEIPEDAFQMIQIVNCMFMGGLYYFETTIPETGVFGCNSLDEYPKSETNPK